MNSNTRTLKYSYGNAYGPNGIFGRINLEITAQGTEAKVLLEHQQLNTVRMWTALLAASVEESIWEALKQSDFPDTARPQTVVPDTTMCELSVVNAAMYPDEVGTSLPLDSLTDLPGYNELLNVLDAVVYQASEGSIQGTSNTSTETVVSEVRLNYTETVS